MGGRAKLLVSFAVFGLLSACAPETVAQAERNCLEQARLAERPRGVLEIGAGSGGYRHGAVGIQFSSDYLMGRDPEEVWQSCVIRRSGVSPTRPYAFVRN